MLVSSSKTDRMIGPSSGTAGDVSESQCCASSKRKIFDDLDVDGSKRKIFDELDIEEMSSFCDEVCQTDRKHYLQELETPMELVTTSNEIIADAAAFFSPMSDAQEVVEESQVARLEVLLVDGTNCTWTTVSELEQQQNLDVLVTSSSLSSSSSSSSSFSSSSSSTSSSGCAERHPTEAYAVEEFNYQPAASMNYWEPAAGPIISLANLNAQQNKETTSGNQQQQQQQQQFEDQENGNLSWLLDFKLDSFIESADGRSAMGPTAATKNNYCGEKSAGQGRCLY